MTDSTHAESILIIDDNNSLSQAYKDYFTKEGLVVYTAGDGVDGYKQAQENKPSIILLDLMMPEMDGLEMLRKLKTNSELKDIPVVVFTALVEGQEKSESLSAGAVAYLEKVETHPPQLLALVKRTLKEHKA